MKITPITALVAFLASFLVYAVPLVLGGHVILPWGLVVAKTLSQAKPNIWTLAILAPVAAAQGLTWFVFCWFLNVVRSAFQAFLVIVVAIPAYFLWLCFALGTVMQAFPENVLK